LQDETETEDDSDEDDPKTSKKNPTEKKGGCPTGRQQHRTGDAASIHVTDFH